MNYQYFSSSPRMYNIDMSDFYTKTGDDGFTGLLGEGRVPKYDPRTEAVGTLDESTAAIGVARAASLATQTENILLEVQRDLYNIMAEVSATPENAQRFRKIDSNKIAWLELKIQELSEIVPMPREFILPGDSLAGAGMAMARTIIRRAERRVAFLIHNNLLENTMILKYLNRLSSLCFVLELLENQTDGKETPTLAKGSS